MPDGVAEEDWAAGKFREPQIVRYGTRAISTNAFCQFGGHPKIWGKHGHPLPPYRTARAFLPHPDANWRPAGSSASVTRVRPLVDMCLSTARRLCFVYDPAALELLRLLFPRALIERSRTDPSFKERLNNIR